MVEEKIVSYGLSSSSLPYYLATFMSIETQEVTIISPFISQFKIPPLDKRFKLKNEDSTSFFGALASLSSLGVRVSIFTTEGYVTKISKYFNQSTQKVRIRVVPELHEKFFISSEFFYKGSANLTYSGLYANIESCEIGLVKTNNMYIRSILQRIERSSKN